MVVRPRSKLRRLPRVQRYTAPVAKVLDLVVSKLGSRRGFRMPSESEALEVFVQEQLQVRPADVVLGKVAAGGAEEKDGNQLSVPCTVPEYTAEALAAAGITYYCPWLPASTVTSSSSSSTTTTTTTTTTSSSSSSASSSSSSSALVQHEDVAVADFLRLVSFERYLPAAGRADDHLCLQVRHTRWQAPLVRRGGALFMLQGFYNGRTLMLRLFDPKANREARLLLDKYDVHARTMTTTKTTVTTMMTTTGRQQQQQQQQLLKDYDSRAEDQAETAPTPLSALGLLQVYQSLARELQLVSLWPSVPGSAASAGAGFFSAAAAADGAGGAGVVDAASQQQQQQELFCLGLLGAAWLAPAVRAAAEEWLRCEHEAHAASQSQRAESSDALQLVCQRARVRRSWLRVEQRRRARERAEHSVNLAVFREWHDMRMADRASAAIRPYLTIPYAQLMELHATFQHFDKDGNDTISAKEFQDMIYEVKGEVLDKKALKQALKEVDRDGNGVVDFNEFVWWFVAPRSQYPNSGGGSNAVEGFFMRLSMELKKHGRKWARHWAADGAKAKAKQQERSAQLAAAEEQRRVEAALKDRAAARARDAAARAIAAAKQLRDRRVAARERAAASLQRAREMAALTTPEAREAYRLAHRTPEEMVREDELRRMEIERIRVQLEAQAREDNERAARQLLEQQEARERAKAEAEEARLREQVESAKRKAAERAARVAAEEEEAAAEVVVAASAAAAAAAAKAKKAEEDRLEAARMEAERVARYEASLAGLDAELRAEAEKRERERQLQRIAEEKMAAQNEAQKAMQKALEKADREKRRAEKEKKKQQKLAQGKQLSKEQRKREILAKRAAAKK